MMAKQGHESSIADTFMHLRSNVDSEGNVKWVNEQAKKTHIFTGVVGRLKKGVIYGLACQPYNVMHRSSSSSRWSSLMEWESERTQLLNHINEMQSSFEARVEAAVEERVSSMEARFMAMFAYFENNMRGLFVNLELPKSSSSHQ